MKLIVGLGNPGLAYSKSRHNVGFDVIDEIAINHGIKINKLKFSSVIGEGRIGDEKVVLLKPTTYMNNSGIAVKEAFNFYKLESEDLLVICDDVDIDFGALRLRKNGSAGTHNGLKSIIYHLVDDSFPRAKLGVGKKPLQYDLADFVLSKFSQEERKIIDETIKLTAKAAACFVTSGIDEAMNTYNTRSKKKKENAVKQEKDE